MFIFFQKDVFGFGSTMALECRDTMKYDTTEWYS